MRLQKSFVVAVVLMAVLGSVGCHKKKPKLPPQPPPPSMEQPTIPPVATQPQPTPPTVSPGEIPAPQPAPPVVKAKKHPRRRKPTASSAVSEPPKTGPKTPEENAPNVQISAEVPQGLADARRQQTENLLQIAEGNLKKINRTLNDGELSMQRQVRNYITQSRLAMQDGDIERAYGLATKAQLLSQELVK